MVNSSRNFASNPTSAQEAPSATPPANGLLGLGTLLRLQFSGADLGPLGQALLARAAADPRDACALMDAATILQFKGNMDLALTLQAEALQMRQHFLLPATERPARLRVLAFMAPGDLMANVPLECLLEHSDAELHLYYLRSEGCTDPIPEHDVLFVALSETENNAGLLDDASQVLADWPRPVVNRPDCIRRIARDHASTLLADVPQIAMPPTVRMKRDALERVAQNRKPLGEALPGHDFPVIVRPLDSHAGHDLAKIESEAELGDYLRSCAAPEFFLSPFIDYRSADGHFRKFRVALIDGQPFACHMGISSYWMIHYLNAGMADSPEKRAEEAAFMNGFDEGFARRHAEALQAIHRRFGLDYVCIDCAEMPDGRLLIFEVDHAMIVHALDPVDLYPYKQPQMQKVFHAFRAMLGRRAANGAAA
jgi:glutathione synthase/RimK-type ligase-like ATP-grasp enzyme